MQISNFNTTNKIILAIIRLAKDNEMSFIDSALQYAEQNGIEIETIAEVIAKNDLIKASIQQEAENLNFIKKTDRLPF